jgi:hypothetical protein
MVFGISRKVIFAVFVALAVGLTQSNALTAGEVSKQAIQENGY